MPLRAVGRRLSSGMGWRGLSGGGARPRGRTTMNTRSKASLAGTPRLEKAPNVGYTSIVSGQEGTKKSEKLETTVNEKIQVVDDIMQEHENFIQAKHVSVSVDPNIRSKIWGLALAQARVEGQNDLRIEMKETNHPDADLKISVARSEGQNNELRAENEWLRQVLAEANDPNAAEKIKKLEEEMRQLKEESQNLRVNNTSGPSYAAIVAASAAPRMTKTQLQTNIENGKTKQTNVLFFKPTSNQKTEEVKNEITKNLNPRQDKIKMKGIRSSPSTVIVETETQNDARKIIEKAATLKDIKCEEPRKSRPLLAVYQVDRHIKDEEFMNALYEINLSDDITRETFDEEVKLKFKTRPKEKKRVNNIIEVSPRIYHILAKNDRVYINFESLKIKEFIKVAWCPKCNDLGHTALRCTREAVCHKCSNKGHTKEKCDNQPVGCIPCSYRKRQYNKAGGSECPDEHTLGGYVDRKFNRADTLDGS